MPAMEGNPDRPRWRRRLGWGLAVAVVAGAAAYVLTPRSPDCGPIVWDTHNVKIMLAEILDGEPVVTSPDGRIDVYRMFFDDDCPMAPDTLSCLRNHFEKMGPVAPDVEAGDYESFAWGRARAADLKDAREPVPVLWYRRPLDGVRLVGFSDGAVRVLTEEEFRALGADGDR
jgi:hypothetical protein